ncbi:MAG: transposase [Woeseiaceae bacterium]
MPRKPRMYLADIPAHVVQRGNNREACFFSDDDSLFYLEVLAQGLRRYKVKLHAYCLMTNHVHLLMTPEDESGISRVMQHIGRHYVQYINKTYRRSGTLWEGRHKASLVDVDNYLLKCYRYIEMNPVAASMVKTPEQYRWSSYQYHAWGKPNEIIRDHILYEELGSASDIKCHAYRELFKIQIPDEDLHIIRESMKYNYPLGNERFKEQVEGALGRTVSQNQRGRPKLGISENR